MQPQEHQQPTYGDLRLIQSDLATAKSIRPGLSEVELIGTQTEAHGLWLARVTSAPGLVSPAHHHGPSEGAFYVLRGQLTFFFGPGLGQRVDVQAGDSIFVPAWTIHAEGNLGSEDVEVLAVRSTPEPIAFYLRDVSVPLEMRAATPT